MAPRDRRTLTLSMAIDNRTQFRTVLRHRARKANTLVPVAEPPLG